MKDYTKEIRGWKMVFWCSLIFSACTLIYIFLNVEMYCSSSLCLFFFFNLFPISLGITIITFPIYLIKNNYKTYYYLIYGTSILLIVNSTREVMYDDFFNIGPKPTYIYIYIASFILSMYIVFKNKNK